MSARAALQGPFTASLGRLLRAPLRSRASMRRVVGAIRAAQERGDRLRIVLGSGGWAGPGWIATDRDVLDVTRERSWAGLLPVASVHALLAEHVWEHLEPGAAHDAARNCFAYLRPQGYLRLAVPDGLHPDPSYRELVRPGGSGPGADDHRVLYDVRTLTELLRSVGFLVIPIEHFDEQGRLVRRPLDPRRGIVWRSFDFDERNADGLAHYTSLIVDAVKVA